MNRLITKIVCTAVLSTQVFSAQPALTLSRNVAIGSALASGAASGALGYGIFTMLEKMYDKARRNVPLSPQEKGFGKQLLQTIGTELATEEDNAENQPTRSLKRTMLASVFVLTLGILGGGLTFQFLDGYTNEGRLSRAESIFNKIDRDELLALIAEHDNWQENDEVLNQIYIKFGAKYPMTKFKKHIKSLLGQLTTAGKYVKAINDSETEELDDEDVNLQKLNDQIKERLTTLRDASKTLEQSEELTDEALERFADEENQRRLIARARKVGHAAHGTYRLARAL